MLLDKGIKAEIVVGESTKKQRDKVFNNTKDWSVLLATFSLAKEGLDVKELDCLHWCSIVGNKIDAVQSAGRIERVCEGKKDPIVIDYVDINIPYCVSRYRKRVGWLKNRE